MGTYQIEKSFRSNASHNVYLATQTGSATKLIIKNIHANAPNENLKRRFKNELAMSQLLNSPHIRKVIGIEDNGETLLLEYIDAPSLRQLIEEKKIVSTSQFLHIAISIAEALAFVHQNHIIHKDINPNNILIDVQTKQATIIDFGISTRLNRQMLQIENPEQLEGSLLYISPEQTGRMNRSIDYRSDFYSLGITLYEMISNTLPFYSDDYMEIVHAHIAQKPMPVAKIPTIIWRIIEKLLQKNAEDRYQSAEGLQFDLQQCLSNLATINDLNFKLGENDFSDKFQIPQKLYGREKEITQLLDVFDQMMLGKSKMLLVTGYSGIGKSALVNEVHKPITERRGYFITGKFDQFKRNVPFYAFIQAFSDLIRQLLTEKQAVIDLYKKELIEALGNNGQVIVDVIPDVELIIGEQTPIPALPPNESQNRFKMVFEKFVGIFTKKEHPITLFIDDLQWADSATLAMIEVLMLNDKEQYLFLIGAYRDNEVDARHPLLRTLEEIKKQKPIEEIKVLPLSIANLSHLVAETMHITPPEATPLAALLHKKTEGNPFFVGAFFKSLYQDELISFQLDTRRWHWDMDKIQRSKITDNVVDLLMGKMQKLNAKTQGMLMYAACLGNSYTIETLSKICPLNIPQLEKATEIASNEGFLLNIGLENYFVHDRVQQAAYALLSAEQKIKLHSEIGTLLLKNKNESEIDEHIFEIVNHLNAGKGKNAITATALATLNLKAGKKAKESLAFQPALDYFQNTNDLLGKDTWETHFDLLFETYKQTSDCLYLSGNKEKAEEIFEILIEKSKTNLQKAKIYIMKVILYESSSMYIEAVKVSRLALALLGVTLPEVEEEKMALFQEEVAFISKTLAEKGGVNYFRTLPAMQNDEIKEAVRTLYFAWTSCYMSGDMNLVLLTAAQVVSLSIKNGNCDESGWAYIAYATFVASGMNNFELGYELGMVAIDVNKEYDDLKSRGAIHHLMGIFIHHWRKPVRTGFHYFRTAFESSIATGNYGYAGYAHCVLARHELLAGINLDIIAEATDKNMAIQLSIKNFGIAQLGIVVNAFIKNLLGRSKNIESFDNEEFNEENYLTTFKDLPIFAAIYEPMKARMYLLYGNYEQSLIHTEKATPLMMSVFGAEWNWMHNTTESLALCGLLRANINEDQKENYLKRIEENQEKMKMWFDNCPENFAHQYQLIEAEKAQLEGRTVDAMNLYDEAIQNARTNQFIQDEALANELCAKFYQHINKPKIAQAYKQTAFSLYKEWGAVQKINLMLQESNLSPQTVLDIHNPLNIHFSQHNDNEKFDLDSILRISHTLSEEIHLETLLKKIMRVLLQNAGADYGVIIKCENGKKYIQAQSSAGEDNTLVLNNIDISEASDRLPVSLIDYVIRSKKHLMFENALENRQFLHDDYILKNKTKSLLCLPIIHKGELKLVLYLENNLAVGVFKMQQLELLKMVSAQMAVSLENASLYQHLEQKVKERTEALTKSLQEVEVQNEEIRQQQEEIMAINEALNETYNRLKITSDRLNSSISYAQQIQSVILPERAELLDYFSDYFTIYLPKDVVSGDFYWFSRLSPTQAIFILADCTGHGVPGAFMTMIGNTLLHEIINVKKAIEPARILRNLNSAIRNVLKQTEGKNSDGMDITVCLFEKENEKIKLSFSGAKTSIFYTQTDKNLVELKGDRLEVGGNTLKSNEFTQKTVVLDAGNIVYLMSDGYADQNNAKRMRLGSKMLKETLQSLEGQSLVEQRKNLLLALDNHQGYEMQRDDIAVIGIKV